MQVRFRSNFRAVQGAGDDAIAELIEKATDEMHETAESRLATAAAKRGYRLPLSIAKETSRTDGKISYDPWFGRFFEYGTVFIRPLPFMRPGNRAGRKVIREDSSEIFQKWFRRRARVAP